jgi:hypothetical protein
MAPSLWYDGSHQLSQSHMSGSATSATSPGTASQAAPSSPSAERIRVYIASMAREAARRVCAGDHGGVAIL